MAKEIIDIGTYDGDPNAEPLRDGLDKTNKNFTELYNAVIEPVYFYFTGRTVRFRSVTSVLYIDHTLTALGFGGIEGVDWEAMQSYP
jgi:hypothetical protein